MPDAIRSIAIIGAGPSGLAAAKYLLEENAFSNIVIYEQRANVGGVWNYTQLPPKQPTRIKDTLSTNPAARAIDVVTARLPNFNTPMYDNLESNLPHMLMQFSDTPFPEGTQLFPSREVVLHYLEEYAEDIKHLIRFAHQVVDVRPKNGSESRGWEVMTKDIRNDQSAVERFDAVIAANGHCDWPLLPDIEGLDAWIQAYPESLHHSVSYKNAKHFVDKRVLLVGGGPSGADISNQIATKCKTPLLRSQHAKSPYHTDSPHMRDLPGLQALIPAQRAAKFADGTVERDIDAIVLCTGYAYSFPFLAALHPDIQTEGIRALPLYRHIFHAHFPTLAFVEVPEMIVPFPLAECQAAVIARVFAGRLNLPSQDAMEQWCESTTSERGCGRRFHALKPPLDLDYMKDMYSWSRIAAGGTQARGSSSSSRGKMPKEWDTRACWLRMNAPEMRKAFAAKGDGRSHISSYEALGFKLR